MKKLFETPEVNSALIPEEDVMAASAELVPNKAGKLAAAADDKATDPQGLWTGSESWL